MESQEELKREIILQLERSLLQNKDANFRIRIKKIEQLLERTRTNYRFSSSSIKEKEILEMSTSSTISL